MTAEEMLAKIIEAQKQIEREGLPTGLLRLVCEIEVAMWKVEDRRRGAWVGWLRRRTVSRLGLWLEG